MDAPIDCLLVKRQNQKKAKQKEKKRKGDFERLIIKALRIK